LIESRYVLLRKLLEFGFDCVKAFFISLKQTDLCVGRCEIRTAGNSPSACADFGVEPQKT